VSQDRAVIDGFLGTAGMPARPHLTSSCPPTKTWPAMAAGTYEDLADDGSRPGTQCAEAGVEKTGPDAFVTQNRCISHRLTKGEYQ
jgi:hypothetical protein